MTYWYLIFYCVICKTYHWHANLAPQVQHVTHSNPGVNDIYTYIYIYIRRKLYQHSICKCYGGIRSVAECRRIAFMSIVVSLTIKDLEYVFVDHRVFQIVCGRPFTGCMKFCHLTSTSCWPSTLCRGIPPRPRRIQGPRTLISLKVHWSQWRHFIYLMVCIYSEICL